MEILEKRWVDGVTHGCEDTAFEVSLGLEKTIGMFVPWLMSVLLAGLIFLAEKLVTLSTDGENLDQKVDLLYAEIEWQQATENLMNLLQRYDEKRKLEKLLTAIKDFG